MLALAAAACGRDAAKPYAVGKDAAYSLDVVVREDVVGTKAKRRLALAARGAFAADGALVLEISRATLEGVAPDGREESVSTSVLAADPSSRSADSAETVKLLEGLKGATVRVAFDPVEGATSVEGLDRALDEVVRAQSSLRARRESLRGLCADDLWRRGLPAAGLCRVPDELRRGAAAERTARVRVAGRGETTMKLAGVVEIGTEGSPGAVLTGRLAADSVFVGEAGAAPPAAVGPVTLAEVEGGATTNWPAKGGMPFKGEWRLTVPHERGLVVRTVVMFELTPR